MPDNIVSHSSNEAINTHILNVCQYVFPQTKKTICLVISAADNIDNYQSYLNIDLSPWFCYLQCHQLLHDIDQSPDLDLHKSQVLSTVTDLYHHTHYDDKDHQYQSVVYLDSQTTFDHFIPFIQDSTLPEGLTKIY